MKRFICLILLVCFCLPVFGVRPYTEKEVTDILQDLIEREEEVKFLREKYLECEKKNLESILELSEEKEINESAGKIAKYFLAGFGIWGIATWGATGGLYPFITGSLFLLGAMK